MSRQGVRSATCIAAVIVTALGVSACAPASNDGPAEITVWYTTGSAGDGLNASADLLLTQFDEENDDITINVETYTMDQMTQLLASSLAGTDGPDLFYPGVTPGRELFEAGLVLDLSDYAEEYGWRERINPTVLEYTTDESGALMGLGTEVEFIGVFYNDVLLDELGTEAPTDLDSTLEFCATASAAGYVPFAHSSNPGWQNIHLFGMALVSTLGLENSIKLLQEGEGSWDSPEVVEAYQRAFVDMRDAGCFPADINGVDYDTATGLFTSGQAVALPTGTWRVGALEDSELDTSRVSIAPFPALGDHPSGFIVGVGNSWNISANSEHKDETARLLDFLMSSDAAAEWLNGSGFLMPVPIDPAKIDIGPLATTVFGTLTDPSEPTGLFVDLFTSQEFFDALVSGGQGVLGGLRTPAEQAAELERVAQN